MSFVRIWIHCVWGTKKKIPFLNNENKWKILEHIKENAKAKNIYIVSARKQPFFKSLIRKCQRQGFRSVGNQGVYFCK